VDGIQVLVHQAVASLEIWLNRPHLTQVPLPGPRGLIAELRAAALGALPGKAAPTEAA
jgi:hypothetical protein